jgi:hypothetical protein
MHYKMTCCWLLLALGLVAGCGGAAGEFVQVSGTVKYADGTPVTGQTAKAVFLPKSPEGRAASGTIEPDGSFKAMTEKPGDGMKPGAYTVVLDVFKDYRAGIRAVPKKYGDASTTPLEATVDADHTSFDFVVEK